MRPKDIVWQGCRSDWQPLFIHEYWLSLGDVAWRGFAQRGRGLVVCTVLGATATVDWSTAAVPYRARFLSQSELSIRADDLGLTAEQRAVLTAAVATYAPTDSIVLLVLSDSPPYLTQLQQWAVPPPECSRQMADRQAEFS